MSTIENAVTVVVSNVHAEQVQTRLRELRQMRDLIPHFAIPETPKATVLLASAASVPSEFVELTVVATTNEQALTLGQAATAAELRDLMRFAEAYAPFADELEAMAQFVRHSVMAARNKVGSTALTTYSLAKRLAKQPQTAHLAPHVADMRRALGKVRKLSPEVLARRAAKKAARAQQALQATSEEP